MEKMSDAEMQVMKLIWERGGEITSAELTDALGSMGMDWKRTTVSTFISRLVDKGALRSARQGRTYTYSARITEDEYLRLQAKDFVDNTYSGDAKGLVAALIESGRISEDDIAELRRYWDSGGRCDG